MNTTLPLIPIESIPSRPPRAGVPSEGIFLRRWQEFELRAKEQAYDDESNEFDAVFRHCYWPWSQAMATAAASLITWLGTNCGHGFLHECRRMAAEMRDAERAYLCAWALENQRLRYINHGLRTIEYLMARQHPIVNGRFFGQVVDWERVPTVTLEEIDAMESVVCWLATPQGEAFVRACESEIEAHRAHERLLKTEKAQCPGTA